MHCGMFCIILSLYPLDASSTPGRDSQKCLQELSHVSCSIENTALGLGAHQRKAEERGGPPEYKATEEEGVVMVRCMCLLVGPWSPDVWSYTVLGVSVKVFFR